MLPGQAVHYMAQRLRGRLPQRGPFHALHVQAQLPRAPMVGAAVQAGGLQGAGLLLRLLCLPAHARQHCSALRVQARAGRPRHVARGQVLQVQLHGLRTAPAL